MLSTLSSFPIHSARQLVENWQDWFVRRGLGRMVRTQDTEDSKNVI